MTERLLATRVESEQSDQERVLADEVIKPTATQEAGQWFDCLLHDSTWMPVVVYQDHAEPRPTGRFIDEERMPRQRLITDAELVRKVVGIEQHTLARLVGVDEPGQCISLDLPALFQGLGIVGRDTDQLGPKFCERIVDSLLIERLRPDKAVVTVPPNG